MMCASALGVVLILVGSGLSVEVAELEALLLDVAQSRGSARGAARRMLIQGYRTAEGQTRAAFQERLIQSLTDTSEDVGIAAAQALSMVPSETAALALLDALRAEDRPLIRHALIRSTARAIAALREPARGIVLLSAIPVLDHLVREPSVSGEERSTLLVLLGRCGPEALERLRALRRDRRWGSILHAELPAAFAATGDPAACEDLIDLYATGTATGFRVGCLHAIGALLQQTPGSNHPWRIAASELIQTVWQRNEDPKLASMACLSHVRSGAASDSPTTVLAAVRGGLVASTADAQKRYLRALLELNAPLDEETRSLLEDIRTSGPTRVHREIAAELLNDPCERP